VEAAQLGIDKRQLFEQYNAFDRSRLFEETAK